MAKLRYRSNYGDPEKTVTEAQICSEMIVARREKRDGRNLPSFFWNDKKWTGTFRILVIQANTIIRTYGEGVLVRALKEDEHITYLIANKAVNPKLQALLDKIVAEDKRISESVQTTDYERKERPTIAKKRGKLEDLE